MGFPILKGSTTAVTNGTASEIVVTVPSGVVAGDLIIVIAGNENSGSGEGLFSTGTDLFSFGAHAGSADSDCYVGCYYHWCDGTEPPTYTIPFGGADDGHAWCLLFENADPLINPQVFYANDSAPAVTRSVLGGQSRTYDYLLIDAIAFDGSDGDPFSVITGFPMVIQSYLESPENTDSGGASSGFYSTAEIPSGSIPTTTTYTTSGTSDGWATTRFYIAGKDAVSININVSPTVVDVTMLVQTPTITITTPHVFISPESVDFVIVTNEANIVRHESVSPNEVAMGMVVENSVALIRTDITVSPLVLGISISIQDAFIIVPTTLLNFDITHELNQLLFQTDGSIVQEVQLQTIDVENPLSIVQKLETHEGVRTLIDTFNIKHYTDWDYVTNGEVNESYFPLGYDAYFPLTTNVIDDTLNYTATPVGTVEFGLNPKHKRLGEVTKFAPASNLSLNNINVIGDFTIAFWTSKVDEWTHSTMFDNFAIYYTPISASFFIDASNKITFTSTQFDTSWNDLMHFTIRRLAGVVSLLVNGEPTAVSSELGDVSQPFTMTYFGFEDDYATDLFVYQKYLTDSEVGVIFNTPKNKIENFDISTFTVSDTSTVFIEKDRDDFKINAIVGNDLNCEVSRFSMMGTVEADYVIHNRQLQAKHDIIGDCKYFFEWKDDISAYGTDEKLLLLTNTASLDPIYYSGETVHYSNAIYGTGIHNLKGAFHKVNMYVHDDDSAYTSWHLFDWGYLASGKKEVIRCRGLATAFTIWVQRNGTSIEIVVSFSLGSTWDEIIATIPNGESWCERPHHLGYNLDRGNYMSFFIDGLFAKKLNARHASFVTDIYFIPTEFIIGSTYNSKHHSSHLRKYERQISPVDFAVLANDPYLVIGQTVELNTITRFNIESGLDYRIDTTFMKTKKNQVHDIFGDKSCVNHWTFSTSAHDTATDGRRKKTYNYGYAGTMRTSDDYLIVQSDNEKDGFLSQTPFVDTFNNVTLVGFNQNITTHTFTISSSSILYDSSDNADARIGVSWAQNTGWFMVNETGGWFNQNVGDGTMIWSIKYGELSWFFDVILPDYVKIGEWNDITLRVHRLSMANMYEVTLFLNGVNCGIQYSRSSIYPVFEGGSEIDKQLWNFDLCGEGGSLGFSQNRTDMGSVRVFNKRLDDHEVPLLNNDAWDILEVDISQELDPTKVLSELDFIRQHISPEYYLSSSRDVSNIFANTNINYLWQFNGNYLEIDNGSHKISGGVAQYEVAEFDEGIFFASNTGIRIGLNERLTITDNISWSYHIKRVQGSSSQMVMSALYNGTEEQATRDFLITIDDTGITVLTGYNTTLVMVEAMPDFTQDKPFHVVLTRSYNGDFGGYSSLEDKATFDTKLYVDGLLIAHSPAVLYRYPKETYVAGYLPIGSFELGIGSATIYTYTRKALNATVDQMRLSTAVYTQEEIDLLLTEQIAPYAFELINAQEDTVVQKDDTIVHSIGHNSKHGLSIIQSFKEGSTFYRFDMVQKLEQINPTVFIKRISE